MAEDIQRFESPVAPAQLQAVLEGTASLPVEKTGFTANLDPVDKAFQRLASKASTKKSDYDVELCQILHKQLKHLPANLTVDMRLWHWLAAKRFAEFVWTRWHGSIPDQADIGTALARGGMNDRFLGKSTLRGRNRNALSRLFFTAEILYDKGDGYRLAASAFANQDRHTSLFEREMGLVRAAAKALIRATRGMGSEEIQKTAKRLNHIGSSLVFETVDERELTTLLK
jgi:hypothetical protein